MRIYIEYLIENYDLHKERHYLEAHMHFPFYGPNHLSPPLLIYLLSPSKHVKSKEM
jgi:hypothetical protein